MKKKSDDLGGGGGSPTHNEYTLISWKGKIREKKILTVWEKKEKKRCDVGGGGVHSLILYIRLLAAKAEQW